MGDQIFGSRVGFDRIAVDIVIKAVQASVIACWWWYADREVPGCTFSEIDRISDNFLAPLRANAFVARTLGEQARRDRASAASHGEPNVKESPEGPSRSAHRPLDCPGAGRDGWGRGVGGSVSSLRRSTIAVMRPGKR